MPLRFRAPARDDAIILRNRSAIDCVAGFVQTFSRDGLPLVFAGVFPHLSVARVSPRINADDRCVDLLSLEA